MSTAPLDDVEYGIVADFAALQSRVAAQLTELRARAEAAEQQLADVRDWPAQMRRIGEAGGGSLAARNLSGWLAAKVRALGVEQPPEPAAKTCACWGPCGHEAAGSASLGEPAGKEQQ